MARFIVTWSANPAVWPTDPKQALSVIEGAVGGADHLLASGAITGLGWFTAEDGYAVLEADSKAEVIGIVQGFFPYYSSEVREVVPWEAGKEAILASARRAAAR